MSSLLLAKDRPLQSRKSPGANWPPPRPSILWNHADTIVSTLVILSAEDSGNLWEALLNSGEVEKSLRLQSPVSSGEDKYLTSLTEAYRYASTWDTQRQILSAMADLVPYTVIQRYLPNITEYWVKIARQQVLMFGMVMPVTISKSPRIRVNEEQLEHYFVNSCLKSSPHTGPPF